MNLKKLNIIFAGGTTGGHLFPAVALAHEFLNRNSESDVLFVSTGRPLELSILSNEGFNHSKISASGVKGLGFYKKLTALLKLPMGVLSAAKVIMTFKPDIIIGVGGYSSVPVILGGFFMRKPVILHEQNQIPGIANKLCSRFAKKIFISFKETISYFNQTKTALSGNPVRRAFSKDLSTDNRKEDSSLHILITGGSQGASGINQAMSDAVTHLQKGSAFSCVHQCGQKDMAILKKAYEKARIQAEVTEFVTDMPSAYARADLIISRSGALTVSEIITTEKPAIFIPFPQAADNHQYYNAKPLADAGAAEIIPENELNGKRLAERLNFYEANRDHLKKMAEKLSGFNKQDAAKLIVDECYKILKG